MTILALPIATVSGLADMDPLEFCAKGFLAAYRNRTLEAYTLDLKMYFAWCTEHQLPPLKALRPHLELFISHMEHPARARCVPRRR